MIELILFLVIVLTGIGTIYEAIVERDIPWSMGKFFLLFSGIGLCRLFW
jgi:ABC-type microcin C transport system permease subunit YejB